MYQQGLTIKDVVESIANQEYVLPAIQREFVWSPDQISSLFDSIMQGFPFGEFLFWNIARKNSAEYRWYGFVRDYHQRINPHCPDLGILQDRALIAVLDGQQRMTAFNIGLRGSMALKQPRKWANNLDAYPRRVLALDLLASTEPDEEGNRYSFDFVDENQIGLVDERLWYKVADVLKMKTTDRFKWVTSHELDGDQQNDAFEVLERLHEAICADPTVVFYEEKKQDIEHVLNIFIRRNSGGTVLSYSDLLLSIAVSQWNELDARREVHQLVDELNQMGNGFHLSKDFVLKAGLMLTDIASVGFKVENFTHENMARLEANWSGIRNALIATVSLVASFGFDSSTIRAQSSLLPIAYYLYRIESPENFNTSSHYSEERKAIRSWLIRSLLKKSGIWGSGLDTLLTALREVIRSSSNGAFPFDAILHAMRQRGKSLDFTLEELEDLSDIDYGDKRLFALLTILFEHVDCKFKFHVDHVFPKSRFTPKKLRDELVDEEDIPDFCDYANRLANLQLLSGPENLEKQAKLPAEWMMDHFDSPTKRNNYRELNYLGDVPESIKGFRDFYESRRHALRQQISEMLAVK